MLRAWIRTAWLPALALLAAGCGSQSATSSPGDAAASAPTTTQAAASTPAGTTATPATHTGLRYAVLGDSYSNGQSTAPGCAWPDQMAKLLDRRGIPISVVANPSVTGATTDQMIGIGVPPDRASHPDVMSVMLGVNDQFQGHTPRQFATDYSRALGDAISITGSARRVIAVDIPDYSQTPAGEEYGGPAEISPSVDAFNRVVRTVAARRHVALASVVGISRRDGANDIADDGLHPSCTQLSQWARRIAPVAARAWRGLTPRVGG